MGEEAASRRHIKGVPPGACIMSSCVPPVEEMRPEHQIMAKRVLAPIGRTVVEIVPGEVTITWPPATTTTTPTILITTEETPGRSYGAAVTESQTVEAFSRSE